MAGYLPWAEAWAEALYGPAGFYRRVEGPAGHFRTAGHAAAGLLAGALARLAAAAGCGAVVDVGAGRGELVTALAEAGCGLRLHGVDVVERPAGLPEGVGWSAGLAELPDPALDGALVIGWELLDVVPCPVLEVAGDGHPRTVLVDPGTGAERLGPEPAESELSWCHRWWPLDGRPPGSRAEVGRPRDELWQELVRRTAGTPSGGVLLAVDYDHLLAHRPPAGTLTGYRAGRQVPPVPDGSCDLTAHVALDAVAAAGRAAGAGEPVLARQREFLQALGISAGPSAAAPAAGGAELLAELVRRSQAAELLDRNGLGGFGWLLQPAGRELPPAGPWQSAAAG